MTEPPIIAEVRSRKTTVVVSIILAALALLVVTGVVVFFVYFGMFGSSSGPVTLPTAGTLAPRKSSFVGIPESAVPGRYKMTDGASASFIVLYDDHTFMNRDGTTFPQYRWDLGADGLFVQWLTARSRYTNIEAPGMYTTATPKGIARMEKLPPYTPSQLLLPKPVASIRLGAQSETNGLTPVNMEGDGEIQRAKIGEAECYELVRRENRPAAYLYLQIAPDLKSPPFTNALVMVEYFDSALPDGERRGLTVQYDAQHGVYANVQPLNLSGSDTWQEVTFYLPRPLFQGRENAGADFRVCAGSPELFVRSVKLVKNTWLTETKMPKSVAVRSRGQGPGGVRTGLRPIKD